MHVDAPGTIIGEADYRGVYSIGFQSVKAQQFAHNHWICGTGMDYGDLLTDVARTAINGTFNGTTSETWLWNTNAIVLAPWGTSVSNETKAAVAVAAAEFANGTRQVYWGPVYDTTGNIATYHPPYWPYAVNLTENVTIPDWMQGWADDFYVWGVQGGA
jgi:hypothetical protein